MILWRWQQQRDTKPAKYQGTEQTQGQGSEANSIFEAEENKSFSHSQKEGQFVTALLSWLSVRLRRPMISKTKNCLSMQLRNLISC